MAPDDESTPTTSSPRRKVEADPATTRTDVEDTAADEPHRSSLDRVVPLRERREKISRVEGHDEIVIALDDLERGVAGERTGEYGPPNIIPAAHAAAGWLARSTATARFLWSSTRWTLPAGCASSSRRRIRIAGDGQGDGEALMGAEAEALCGASLSCLSS